MKKILFVASVASLLATGCWKTEIENPVGEPSLSFSTGLNKITKAHGTADAANDGEVNLQAQDFRVWAYANFDDPNTTAVETNTIYDGMENLNVYYTKTTTGGTDGASVTSWAPKKQYYWPGKDKNLLFFAVSGASCGDDLAKDQTAVTVNPSAKTITVNNFAVTPATPNTDLMIADIIDQNQGKKEVDLKFHHALSKVEFLFKTNVNTAAGATDRMRVLVQSVKVDNLYASGTLNVSAGTPTTKIENNGADAGTVHPVTLNWAAQAENATTTPFEDDYQTEYTEWSWDGSSKIELIDGTSVDNPSSAQGFDKTAMALNSEATVFTTWLMVPQSIAGKKVTVKYIINNRQFETIFALDTQTLKSWDVNQYIKYTVTLTPNLISFVPSVEDWQTKDENNVDMSN